MSSRRTSLHIRDEADAILAEDGDFAKRVNFIVNAYSNLIESPSFTLSEWLVLLATYSNFSYNAHLTPLQQLFSFSNCIPTAPYFPTGDELIDKLDLAKRYWALPLNQRFFVYELARLSSLPAEVANMTTYQEWLISKNAIITED